MDWRQKTHFCTHVHDREKCNVDIRQSYKLHFSLLHLLPLVSLVSVATQVALGDFTQLFLKYLGIAQRLFISELTSLCDNLHLRCAQEIQALGTCVLNWFGPLNYRLFACKTISLGISPPFLKIWPSATACHINRKIDSLQPCNLLNWILKGDTLSMTIEFYGIDCKKEE